MILAIFKNLNSLLKHKKYNNLIHKSSFRISRSNIKMIHLLSIRSSNGMMMKKKDKGQKMVYYLEIIANHLETIQLKIYFKQTKDSILMIIFL